MNMNTFYSGSTSVSGGVNQSVFLFNLAEDSITRANVCFMRGNSENEPKETTRPHVIVEKRSESGCSGILNVDPG